MVAQREVGLEAWRRRQMAESSGLGRVLALGRSRMAERGLMAEEEEGEGCGDDCDDDGDDDGDCWGDGGGVGGACDVDDDGGGGGGGDNGEAEGSGTPAASLSPSVRLKASILSLYASLNASTSSPTPSSRALRSSLSLYLSTTLVGCPGSPPCDGAPEGTGGAC